MDVFKYVKEKYNLTTNLKGIEYITSLENEIENLIQSVEDQKEYAEFLQHENHLLYGRLNNIISLAEKEIR